jgi:hypothetical protein
MVGQNLDVTGIVLHLSYSTVEQGDNYGTYFMHVNH